MKKLVTLLLAAGLMASGMAMADQHEDQKGGDRHSKMKRFDTDHDGKLSREEHRAMSEKRFSKADANGDGFVTQKEHNQAKKKHQAHKSGKRPGNGERSRLPQGQHRT